MPLHLLQMFQKALFIGIIFCLLLQMRVAIAATEFKIFTLQHRFAEDIVESIRPFVGNDGSAAAIQNQLIIRAAPQQMREIEALVETLDAARQNLKITISRANTVQQNNSAAGVSGSRRFGNIEIGTQRFPNSHSNDGRDNIDLTLQNNQRNTQSNSQQFINVIDGEPAFINVGQSIPFTQEWVTLTRRYASVKRTTEFVDVTTGFAVRPRSIGNQIELAITPRIAQLNARGFIDFETLTTTVRVTKGEWLNIGGIMQQNDEVSRAILRHQSANSQQNNQLNIRVD